MQNSLTSKEGNILEFAAKANESAKGMSVPGELTNRTSIASADVTAIPQAKAFDMSSVCVIKKDGTKEPFDSTKIINAVKKSATRALVEFTEEDLKSICDFVNNNIIRMNKQEIAISEMHNLVEGALEHLYPQVAQSYRNYRNYKQDFVHILYKVYH